MEEGQSEESLIEARERSNEGQRPIRQAGKCCQHFSQPASKVSYECAYVAQCKLLFCKLIGFFYCLSLFLNRISDTQDIFFYISCAEGPGSAKCCRISPQNLVCISHAFSAWVSIKVFLFSSPFYNFSLCNSLLRLSR